MNETSVFNGNSEYSFEFFKFELQIRELLEPIDLLKTGSRFIGDATEESDYDLVVLVFSLTHIKPLMKKLGWEDCSDVEYEEESSEYFICRKGKLNLIITNKEENFKQWKSCTKVAKKLGLNKEQRVILFDTIRKGSYKNEQ